MVKYVFVFYNSILVLTGNDIGTNSMDLMIVGIMMLLCGCVMNANIFGTIIEVFQQMNKKEM